MVSPLHNFIPFLLLGLGVDDMFVIVQALDVLERNISLETTSAINTGSYDADHLDCNNEKHLDNGNKYFVILSKPRYLEKVDIRNLLMIVYTCF